MQHNASKRENSVPSRPPVDCAIEAQTPRSSAASPCTIPASCVRGSSSSMATMPQPHLTGSGGGGVVQGMAQSVTFRSGIWTWVDFLSAAKNGMRWGLLNEWWEQYGRLDGMADIGRVAMLLLPMYPNSLERRGTGVCFVTCRAGWQECRPREYETSKFGFRLLQPDAYRRSNTRCGLSCRETQRVGHWWRAGRLQPRLRL